MISKILIKYTGYKLLALCQGPGKVLFWKTKKIQDLVIPDHFSFKKCQIYSLNKLASKDLDLILDDANSVKAAAEDGAYVPV